MNASEYTPQVEENVASSSASADLPPSSPSPSPVPSHSDDVPLRSESEFPVKPYPTTTLMHAPPSSRLRMLLVKDVDVLASSRLVDTFIQAAEPRFDLIIACGPLSHRDIKTDEDEAMAIGDFATVLAQLENIACRVVYLGAHSDPADAVYREAHLTPNALNLHARWVDLVPGLRVGGYTERSQLERSALDGEAELEGSEGEEEEEEEETGALERMQGGRSAAIVRDVLLSSAAPAPSSSSPPLLPASIFILQSQHMHTTNQLLFFSQEELQHANVATVVVPHMGGGSSGSHSNSSSSISSSSSEAAGGSHAPSVPQPRDIQGVRAIFLGSMREQRTYTELEFALCERARRDGSKEMKWVLVDTSVKTI